MFIFVQLHQILSSSIGRLDYQLVSLLVTRAWAGHLYAANKTNNRYFDKLNKV